jgi:hypothetical protein
MIAQEDQDLAPWLYGIANGKPHQSGDFLRALVDAAFRADPLNYPVLRPSLVIISKRYPQYRDDHPENPVTGASIERCPHGFASKGNCSMCRGRQ